MNIEELYNYVNDNDVVFQFAGELIEDSCDQESEESLLAYISKANLVKACAKTDIAREGWLELLKWATEDDVFIVVDEELLICIPLSSGLIEA